MPDNAARIDAGMLVHLSTNLWNDSPVALVEPYDQEPFFSPRLRFDRDLWIEMSNRMADAGFTYALLDLGDAIVYESHPEIAVDGAWSTTELREELDRLRGIGLEPLPKLNFSSAHDAWMGPYARRVSTPEYYAFCADLIGEVSELFDRPRLFHIGMDEETLHVQRTYPYVVLRQHDLWWHDLEFLAEEVRRAGSRAWMWSDYAWSKPDFFAKASTSIVQSNWHYEMTFSGDESGRPHVIDWPEGMLPPTAFLTYLDLQDGGFDQIPTASTWIDDANFARTVEFGRSRLQPDRVLGYLQSTWKRMLPEYRDIHERAIAAVAATLVGLDTGEQS